MEGNRERLDPYTEWRQDFMLAVIENESSFPEGSENRHTGAFATAVRTAMRTEYFEETVNAMFIREDRVRGDNAFQLLFRVFLADQLEYVGDDNFTGLDDPQRCLDVLEEIHADPDRSGMFYAMLVSRQVQSNIADRYKSVQLLAALLSDRFDTPPNYLDIGSSELHGPIKAVFGNDPTSECPPFSSTEFLRVEKVRALRLDPIVSFLANTALFKEVEYGVVVGTDMTNIDDPVTMRWVETCSLKPYERANPANIEEFRLLNAIDPHHERVGFIRADFTSPRDFALFRDQSPVEKYDIISIKTVLHQIRKKEERVNMLKHAKEVLNDTGILVIQEFISGNTSKKFNYQTQVIDMQMPNDDPQPMIRWENGRCKRGIFETGKILFGGVEKTPQEAVLDMVV